MSKKLAFGCICLLAALFLAAGCRRGRSSPPPVYYGYFQQPWQTESEFIVTAIVSDLAEQIYYAARHQLPDGKYFSVTAKERPGPRTDTPTYDLSVKLDKHHADLKLDVTVNGPIWSPDVYRDTATALAAAVGLNSPGGTGTDDMALLSDLLDSTAETIERENRTLSDALEKNFVDPQLHEQAALLLGAFLLRDHSGYFFEICSPLSRMTAHLTMARFLSGTDSFGLNGKLAEAAMLTMVCDEAAALDELKTINSKDAAVAAMVRALQVRNTKDYRPLSKMTARSSIESVACFAAMGGYASLPKAWENLDNDQKMTIDFVRVADAEGFSVQIGHQLLRAAIPLELQEITKVYELSRGKKLDSLTLTNLLNESPERCFSIGLDGKNHVRVIGWGQWAMFLQRHLCNAVMENFNLMNNMWDVPDDAKKFAAQCDLKLGGLRLYPFVRRFNCTDVEGYHKAVDDGFKVTVATPQFVPAQCWNYLCYRVRFASLYTPNPNPHINEWHNHNPPPGTVYDLEPRLNHPSLVSRPDALVYMDQLHQWAPYDIWLAYYIIQHRYNDHPTYLQAMTLLHDILPWSVYALRTVAFSVYDQPQQYEKLMLQAAELDPSVYYELGNYADHQHEEDKAEQYFDKACDNDPDSVRASNYAERRVRYYLKKGMTATARTIADLGGEAYSARGLLAKAYYFEATSNYDDAFEWYAKDEERYDDSGPLMAFCERYKMETGNTRFDSEVQKRQKILFPTGLEKVSLADFRAPPTDGVLVNGQSDVLSLAGMKRGDVIVALRGLRVHTFKQYSYVRDSQTEPEMDMIVWQGNGFSNIKANPPDHRFNVDCVDYKPN